MAVGVGGSAERVGAVRAETAAPIPRPTRCDDGRITALTAAVVGYLVGSIPTAYLVGHVVAHVDLRVEGEGNIGARNAFHVVGRWWGVAVFVADFGKGVLVASLFLRAPQWQLAVAATAVLVGHCYPVWIRFVGGKGLSTAGGVSVALVPWAAVAGAAAAGVVWLVRRRFLPTTVAAIVAGIVAAPWLAGSAFRVGLVVWLFVLTGVKRMLDEPRMREVESSTGWDRVRGLRS